MTNLVEQYGTNWFTSKFGGSYFMHEDTPHMVQQGEGRWRTAVPCMRIEKREDGTSHAVSVTVHANFFENVGVFSVPNLGWRAADDGKYLSYFSRNNSSYHRGLSDRNLVIADSQLTNWLRLFTQYTRRPTAFDKALMALQPEFTPMTEGVEKMRSGDIVSFAVSPTIAVVPDIDDKLSIMFKTKKAGTVMPDNTLSFVIPEISTYMENT